MIRKSNNQLRNVCAVPAAGVPDGVGEDCFTPSIYTVSDRRVRNWYRTAHTGSHSRLLHNQSSDGRAGNHSAAV